MKGSFFLPPRFSALPMPRSFPHMEVPPSRYDPWATQLTALWADMDGGYTAAAEQYGFECRGCADNCCQTRFYHHTLLEYLYLLKGYQQLDSGLQKELRQRAQVVSAYQARADRDVRHDDHMCPLNMGGYCRLYAQRPMICRLHGLPHELHPGNGRVVRGPGCSRFAEQCGERPYVLLDRTPFYARMAELEKGLRQATGYRLKIKMTVAEMVSGFRDR